MALILQVDHPDYGKWEPTNEIWYSQFDAYLREISNGEVGFYTHVEPQVIFGCNYEVTHQ